MGALALDAQPLDRREIGNRVDPLGGDAELDRQIDIAAAERVDERIDTARGRFADPLRLAFAVEHRHDVMRAEPFVVWLAREADHVRAGPARKLHGDRSDTAGGGRHHHRLAGSGRHRLHRGVGGHADDEQGTCDLPGQCRGLLDQLLGRDRYQLGLARALLTPAEHLVPGSEAADARTDGLDQAGEVGPLT